MKLLKSMVLVGLGISLAGSANAQFNMPGGGSSQPHKVSDPTHWSYDVKKLNANEYELIFHVTLGEGWHIWSIHPGGDGFIIPPTFTFDKNTSVNMDGKVKEENGKAIVGYLDGVDGKVTYYKNYVDYVQKVRVKGHTTITGKQQYQVCSDDMCLPPKTIPFRFMIK